MPLFARRPRLPGAAVDALDLGRGERVLAFDDLGRGVLVATDHRLAVLSGTDAAGPDDVVAESAWHLVDSAVWDRDTSTLRVRWVDGAPAWTFAVEEPDRDLMTTIRARVQSTLVSSHQTRVAGRTVRAALRRDLRTGELLIQHQYGQGLRDDDPRVAAAAAALDDLLREEAGLPPDFTSGAGRC